ncbi:unnamed protein product [Thelazia callipaeda]|uniref:PDZ domain-containing protein n=1 Tax=Thelazia callipaeda TaxID=103827 RepID=A0A0N5D276_THECL|nr:unnamed protein product [Thelazia callipaeda]
MKDKKLQIIHVDPEAPASKWAFSGDTIIAVDEIRVRDARTLRNIMNRPTTKATLRIRRNTYSHSRRIKSTVETFVMKHETKLLRAISIYLVCVHVGNLTPPDLTDALGLSVSYDARERLEVVSTRKKGVAAIHLHPGDTIKEVNGHPVASKSMLQYWILASMEANGFVEFLIQCDMDKDTEPDQEMPQDVKAITERQLKTIRSSPNKVQQTRKAILKKHQSPLKTKQTLKICDKVTELPIASDWDEKKLKKVKKGQH